MFFPISGEKMRFDLNKVLENCSKRLEMVWFGLKWSVSLYTVQFFPGNLFDSEIASYVKINSLDSFKTHSSNAATRPTTERMHGSQHWFTYIQNCVGFFLLCKRVVSAIMSIYVFVIVRIS